MAPLSAFRCGAFESATILTMRWHERAADQGRKRRRRAVELAARWPCEAACRLEVVTPTARTSGWHEAELARM